MRYRQTGNSVGCTVHVQIQRRLYSALRIIEIESPLIYRTSTSRREGDEVRQVMMRPG